MADDDEAPPRSEFVYTPLDLGSDNIRVLKVVPGDSKIISCELKETSTEAGHVCLSYTWGDEPASMEILVNHRSFMIRPNLWHFLLEVRRRSFDRWIWIDAICLNQRDVRERNHQVQRMADIYKGAEFVIVWLGSASAAAESILLKRTFRHPAQRNGNTLLTRPAYSSQDEARALSDLYHHDYWHRLWIVQELMLAKKAMIWCNESEFELRTFIAIAKSCVETQPTTDTRKGKKAAGVNPMSAVEEMSARLTARDFNLHQFSEARSRAYRGAYRGRPRRDLYNGMGSPTQPGTSPLPELIPQWANSRCQNPLDKIYGLLGLADRGHDFPVAYDITTTDLCFKVLDWVAVDQEYIWPYLVANLCQTLAITPSDIFQVVRTMKYKWTVLQARFQQTSDQSVWFSYVSADRLALTSHNLPHWCVRCRQPDHETRVDLEEVLHAPSSPQAAWVRSIHKSPAPTNILQHLRAVTSVREEKERMELTTKGGNGWISLSTGDLPVHEMYRLRLFFDNSVLTSCGKKALRGRSQCIAIRLYGQATRRMAVCLAQPKEPCDSVGCVNLPEL